MRALQPFPRCRCEFHVSRRARDAYGFDEAVFGSNGNIVFADFHAARLFADRINRGRDVENHPERAVKASEINALGLIDELLHAILAVYRQRVRPTLLREALDALEHEIGGDAVDEVLAVFVDEFPPVAVYRGELSVEGYLAGETDGVPNRETALEELLLLRLANTNPAFAPFRELFDDTRLRRDTAYDRCLEVVEAFFAGRPGLGDDAPTLLDLLLAPMRAAPTSLEGQLAFIRGAWGDHIGELVLRVLSSLDFVAEESRPFFGGGPGPVPPPRYDDLGEAPERYSPDLDWMPRVVLLAKNVYVWLAQLSQRYDRAITTLDAVPDDELDRLAGWGFTGLWLIGVWQRSRASEKIKRWMGDEDAVASAYSLADYVIADDLGGEAAFDDLKARAWRRGIRMSTDMVPNHMGIDSRWVIEHPDWFIGVDRPPFPSYRFTGEDLSDDERVGIYIEDGYWNRTDAAVVFKRVDHWTGAERYIYHGNDGTSMPWNDTAQLDYRLAEVREAVIQTILHVARRSPIIRFDAAMTLAKKHYQRLWFPEPGTGGDIPSRAEHGMTRAEFDEVMPEEFWREVVDRVSAEAPDTLLLAEAFWLLEGFFVRTLGMHRVYNSAFMNMLRDERNADYRLLMKSTLEYDPQILKRYVNFMSNPDERTAIDQFGADGKYFGVATMMATLPGLPMFGHGQVEGFAEKYGMEFRRPRWDETPNEDLIRRHERQLFPLLHRRASFAEVDRFLLYDFETADGGVDENVFAYSNEAGGERSLVVFHNRFADTSGVIRLSTAKLVRSDGGDGVLQRFSLADGLGLDPRPGRYVVLHDVVTGLEHLHASRTIAEHGLAFELDAYRCHAFVDIRELDDEDGLIARLDASLGGRGVDSVDLALAELELEDVLTPFAELVNGDRLRRLAAGDDPAGTVAELQEAFLEVVDAIAARLGIEPDRDTLALRQRCDLERAIRLSPPAGEDDQESPDRIDRRVELVWSAIRGLSAVASIDIAGDAASSWLDRWLFARVLAKAPAETPLAADEADRFVDRVRLLDLIDGWWRGADPAAAVSSLLGRLLDEEPGRRLLGVNSWDGVLWYRGEAFDDLAWWLARVAELADDYDPEDEAAIGDALAAVADAHRSSGFRVDRLREGLER